MAKRRKSVATHLDEADRNIFYTFCSAANSLSQLYTQSMSQQKLSFQAGERHSLDKLYNWILRQQEDGTRVTSSDITAYIQNELEYGTEETPMSPRLPFQQDQHYQTAMHLSGSGIPVLPNSSGPVSTGQGVHSAHSDHLGQGGYYPNNIISSGNGNRNSENGNRDSNNPSSNDSSMDMHADSPGHESPY